MLAGSDDPLCVFTRDAGRALAAGHTDEAEEGQAGRRSQREDRAAARTHGASGEENPASRLSCQRGP